MEFNINDDGYEKFSASYEERMARHRAKRLGQAPVAAEAEASSQNRPTVAQADVWLNEIDLVLAAS